MFLMNFSLREAGSLYKLLHWPPILEQPSQLIAIKSSFRLCAYMKFQISLKFHIGQKK